MPIYIESPGYDRLQYWTRMELRRLYQDEGYSTLEATKMAQCLYEAIRNLNRKEVYSWSKARELESPSGNASDLEEIAANYFYVDLDYGQDVWDEIESLAMPDKRKVTHYERLRGKRMRLSPEVKEARRRARETLRELQREAENESRFQWLLERARELREKCGKVYDEPMYQ